MLVLEKTPYKILKSAVFSKTGWGDGTYEVYGKRNKDGELVALYVYFD
ncbi:DUF4241 domain-containing protein [Anaerocellum danielii]